MIAEKTTVLKIYCFSFTQSQVNYVSDHKCFVGHGPCPHSHDRGVSELSGARPPRPAKKTAGFASLYGWVGLCSLFTVHALVCSTNVVSFSFRSKPDKAAYSKPNNGGRLKGIPVRFMTKIADLCR